MAIPGDSGWIQSQHVSLTASGGQAYSFQQSEFLPSKRVIGINQKIEDSIDGYFGVRDLGGYVYKVPFKFRRLPQARIDSFINFMETYVHWHDELTISDTFGDEFTARLISDFNPVERDAGHYDLNLEFELIDDGGFSQPFSNGTTAQPYFRKNSSYYNFSYQDVSVTPFRQDRRWKKNVHRFEDNSHQHVILSPEMRHIKLHFEGVDRADVLNLIRFFDLADINWCQNDFTLALQPGVYGSVQLADTRFEYTLDEKDKYCSFDLNLRQWF